MGISEAERRVDELNALVKCQLRLIRKLERRGKDLTSAKIVFDSLRVSLFLANQDWHRALGNRDATQVGTDVDRMSSWWESKPNLVVVSHTNTSHSQVERRGHFGENRGRLAGGYRQNQCQRD